MKKLNLKKVAAMSLALTLSSMLLFGCSSEKEDTTTEAKTDEATTEAAATESEYDNSYCADGVPSAKLTELRESGTLKVGSSGDAPFAYIDQDTGEFSGVDAEIIKEAAKRLGIENVEMELIPFSELILNLNSSNIDIIADCMYIRADRAEQVYLGEIWYT